MARWIGKGSGVILWESRLNKYCHHEPGKNETGGPRGFCFEEVFPRVCGLAGFGATVVGPSVDFRRLLSMDSLTFSQEMATRLNRSQGGTKAR